MRQLIYKYFIYQLLPEANLCDARGASLGYQYRILMLLEEYPNIARDGSYHAQQTIIIAMQRSSNCPRDGLIFIGEYLHPPSKGYTLVSRRYLYCYARDRVWRLVSANLLCIQIFFSRSGSTKSPWFCPQRSKARG